MTLARSHALRYLVGAAALALVAIVGWAGYVAWRERQLIAFREGAHEAHRAKQWERVSELAGEWAKREPKAAMPVLLLAEAAQEQGDLQQASDYLGQLPTSDPRTVRGLLERTNLLFGPLNQPFEGAETCKRVIRLEPANVEAWQRLTFFYAVTVQRVALERATREAVRRGADTPETYLYLVGADWLNLANGFDTATRWLQGDPENETLLVARAVNYIYSTNVHEQVFNDESMNHAGAPQDQRPYHEQVMADYLNRFPKNVELLDYYLKQYSTAGDAQKVAELLAQAPPESAEDGRFWRHQGWLLTARGRISEAEKALKKALELNPCDWRSQHQASALTRQAGDLEKSKRQAEVAAEGKQLEKTIYQLANVQSLSPQVLGDIAHYLEQCGETELATPLRTRWLAAKNADTP